MIQQTTHDGLEVLHAAASKAVEGRPPLVFLHGAFASAWIWAAYYMPWFAAAGWDCYALSYRGHGKSDGRDRLNDFGVDDYVADSRALLELLGRAPVLIGHSMGGYLAQRLVHQGAGIAYVLMSSVPPTGLVGPAITLAWLQPKLLGQLFEIQCRGMELANPEVLHKAFFRHDLPQEMAAAYLAHVQDESQRATWDLYWPVATDLGPLHRVPGLVMGARGDRVISPLHVQHTAVLLGRPAVLLADVGHAMMLEPGWELGAEKIRDFLDETFGVA